MNQGLIILATITLVAGYLVYREIDTIKRKFGEIEKNSLEVEKIKRSIAIISGQSVYTPSNNSLVELNTQQNLIQKENKTDSDIESEYESSQVEEIKYDSDSDSVSDYNSETEREKTIVKPNNEDENVYELVKEDETKEDENENTKEYYKTKVINMNVKEIKQELRDKKLKTSGKRQELIDRLIESY